MYLGVDLGGTKTLVAALDDDGTILEQAKFLTPAKYDNWLLELRHIVHHFEHKDLRAAAVAVPGKLNREHGTVLALGNLAWRNEPIQADCEKIFDCPVVIENDAKLAGLSEAMLHKDAAKILYVTISTGIGTAVIYNQRIDEAMRDSEGGMMQLPYHGQLKKWEGFASGKAIVERFGKKAKDIDDETTWKTIVHDLSLGLFEHIALVQPDLIIIGGSVGAHFEKYDHLLEAELKKYELPIVPIPPVAQAQRPELAVIYGCYDIAKQRYPVHGKIAQPA